MLSSGTDVLLQFKLLFVFGTTSCPWQCLQALFWNRLSTHLTKTIMPLRNTVQRSFRVPAGSRRYRFFDSVMLEMMAHHGERIESIFMALFKRNPAERVFRFPDEAASLWENCLMIPFLPPQLLLQALLRLDALGRV
jgi:lycopene beta-cyclase